MCRRRTRSPAVRHRPRATAEMTDAAAAAIASSTGCSPAARRGVGVVGGQHDASARAQGVDDLGDRDVRASASRGRGRTSQPAAAAASACRRVCAERLPDTTSTGPVAAVDGGQRRIASPGAAAAIAVAEAARPDREHRARQRCRATGADRRRRCSSVRASSTSAAVRRVAQRAAPRSSTTSMERHRADRQAPSGGRGARARSDSVIGVDGCCRHRRLPVEPVHRPALGGEVVAEHGVAAEVGLREQHRHGAVAEDARGRSRSLGRGCRSWATSRPSSTPCTARCRDRSAANAAKHRPQLGVELVRATANARCRRYRRRRPRRPRDAGSRHPGVP